jgi:hypothetical protein
MQERAAEQSRAGYQGALARCKDAIPRRPHPERKRGAVGEGAKQGGLFPPAIRLPGQQKITQKQARRSCSTGLDACVFFCLRFSFEQTQSSQMRDHRAN